jgi:hypothetical protein
MKRLNECGCGCGGAKGGCNDNDANYMFFGNLKTIKKYVDAMLQMDPRQVQSILSNGHDWAADHVATSKDDIQEVGDFLMNTMHHEKHEMPGFAGNTTQPQFVPVGFKDQLKQAMHETIRKVDGGYAVYPSKGGKRLGTHKTRKAALKQLAAIEISKHKK